MPGASDMSRTTTIASYSLLLFVAVFFYFVIKGAIFLSKSSDEFDAQCRTAHGRLEIIPQWAAGPREPKHKCIQMGGTFIWNYGNIIQER